MKNYLLIAVIFFSCNNAENKTGIADETKAEEKSNEKTPPLAITLYSLRQALK